MSRKFPQTLFAFLFGIFVIASPAHSFAATAGGGACPTGANYLDLNNPQSGGGQGSVTLSSLGITSCYYIAANGSDSNAGTSETAAWLHAPGMPACSGTCAAVNPGAGTGFIFRGGDTWHVSSGSPSTGGSWRVGQSGTDSNPIYFGVDISWDSGSSFARPIISLDNPPSTLTVSSCAYDDDGVWGVNLSGDSHLILDNFEFTGACSTGGGHGGYVFSGSDTYAIRIYTHGWTLASGAADDVLDSFSAVGGTGPTNHYFFNVTDGSDSTYGTVCTSSSCVPSCYGGKGCATSWAYADAYDIEYSIIRHTSNPIEAANPVIIHDNLIEYNFNPSFGGRHGNVLEALGGLAGNTNLIYNNIFRDNNEGVHVWLQCTTCYVFNNVFEDYYDGNLTGVNCLMLSPPGFSNEAASVSAAVVNNTFDSTCADVQGYAGNGTTPHWASGSTILFENNQFIGVTSLPWNCGSPSSCTLTDSGGEVYQPTSIATSQGYVLAGDFYPPAGGSTVGAGNNATNHCSVFGSALCSATPKAVAEAAGNGGYIASYPVIAIAQRPTSGPWDAGAYLYGASSTPAPPTGLSAQVQ